jgi:hypothetical protein
MRRKSTVAATMMMLKLEMALMLALSQVPWTMVWRRQGLLSQMLKTVLSAWYHITKDLVVATVYASLILSLSTETFDIYSRNTIFGPVGTTSKQFWRCPHLLHMKVWLGRFSRRHR